MSTRSDRMSELTVAGGVVALACWSAWIARQRLGHVGYPLDDAYIHLRVSEMIHSGHYGLNPDSAAAPSSSILWPFLLAPFAGVSWHSVVPLVLNLLCLGGSVVVGTHLLRRAWEKDRWRRWAAPTAGGLCVVSNLVATSLAGMEHSLQTLLVLLIGLGVVDAVQHRPLRWWWWVAVAVVPLVRYESALVSGAALMLVWFLGERRRVGMTAVAIVVGWAGFGLFLVSRGLDPLPSSILVKSSAGMANLGRHGGVVPLLAGAALVTTVVGIARRDRTTTLTAGFVTVVFAGHMFAASTDALRYATSVIALAGLLLVSLAPSLVPTETLTRAGAGVCAALLLSVPGVRAAESLAHSPAATEQIAQQQCRLHDLVVRHLREAVAANDIGCVAYRNPDPVLDLWGLASQEARRARLSERHGWMERIVRRHGVDVALVYHDWFGDDLPATWVRVGGVESTAPGYASRAIVDVYATEPSAIPRIRRALLRSANDQTPGTTFTVDR